MLTIREIKARTELFFKEKGVPDSKLDTDILIAHSLGVKRLDLYLDLDRPLSEAQLALLRPLVRRRANREPLQYILGSHEFCGLKLKVDARALIPRQETEQLVELLLERLKSSPQRILDLGTGTGALALALAVKYPQSVVTAVDLSAEALSLAQENAVSLGLAERVQFLAGSWCAPLAAEQQFDLVVSNPPYLTEAEMTTAKPEVVDHEPTNALVSGSDGLDDLRMIFAELPQHLAAGGVLVLETGISQATELNQLAAHAGLRGEMLEDWSGRPRFYWVERVST